jgi:hypothetical protein
VVEEILTALGIDTSLLGEEEKNALVTLLQTKVEKIKARQEQERVIRARENLQRELREFLAKMVHVITEANPPITFRVSLGGDGSLLVDVYGTKTLATNSHSPKRSRVRVDGKEYPSLFAAYSSLYPHLSKRGRDGILRKFASDGRKVEFIE